MGNDCKFIHAQTVDALANTAPKLVSGLDTLKELHEDFDALVNKAPLMIFMEGNPKNPLSEFSRALIDILWETRLAYDHHDVLNDKNVHQGLQKLSNCMTYPQVFVNGVFIGDLDTIKKLKQSGDLVEKLKI